AFVLSVDSSRHQARPVRLHRVLPIAEPAGWSPRAAQGERVRAGRGARLRQDGARDRGRRNARVARAAPRLRRESAELDDSRRALDAGDFGLARRAVRAQRVYAGRHLEHRLVRSMGCGARQAAGTTDRGRGAGLRRCRGRPRQLDCGADPPLPGFAGGRWMTAQTVTIDDVCINTIRVLSIDAVEQAASGHPGMPMGAAPPAYVLWTRQLPHDPIQPKWVNRDRFVLSAGHGSMLLYSLLLLTGYDLTLDDLKHFRRWCLPQDAQRFRCPSAG